MKKIELSGKRGFNKFLTIDDNDFVKFSQYKWYLHNYGYAFAVIDGKRKYAHHLAVGKAIDGFEVDHINLNKLDNRKSNLRKITIKENRQNKTTYKKYRLSKSKRLLPKGVYKRKNTYQAQIRVNKKTIYLGSFKTAEQAGKRYELYCLTRNLNRVETKNNGSLGR